jgi:hypothetical protein
MTTRDRTAPDDVVRRLAAEADALDHAVYDAVASTPTPTLDVPARWLSKAANYSVLSILIAGVLATVGGHGGRRAAVRGLTAIGATSIFANLIVKPVFARRRRRAAARAEGHARFLLAEQQRRRHPLRTPSPGRSASTRSRRTDQGLPGPGPSTLGAGV